jgi:peroxisomal enoyl-CoA hydratase 2
VPDMWVDDLGVGQEFDACLVEDLTRAHIAQYAGASGDFNSVHVDEEFARSEAGRPSVIAHGMLTMGLTGTFLASVVGSGTLRSFGGRFLAPVAPGDTLRCVVTVVDVVEDGVQRTVSFHLETRTAAGAVVFRGEATAIGPAEGNSSAIGKR